MDYKKKYEDAVKKLEKFFINDDDRILYKHDIESVFPELRDSKDEKIRKWLIEMVEEVRKANTTNAIHNENCSDAIAWLEKQGEQKPTDKVEPKFKVGDWIISSEGTLRHIIAVDKTGYETNEGWLTHDDYEKNFHLWTIQDAKDGDVLAYENDIVIFKENNYNPEDKSGCMFVYCSCNNFYEIGGINPTYYKPATKEQHELLFQKMKEAGYEWDAEKKELKKIGQEEDAELTDFESALFSAFSDAWQEYLRGEEVNVAKWAREHSAELLEVVREQKPEPKQEWKQENTGDLTDFENAMMHIGGSFFGDNAGLDPNDTNAIKEQANILLGLVQKQEWSEEDEKIVSMLVSRCNGTTYTYDILIKMKIWLKSIKERMKGE